MNNKTTRRWFDKLTMLSKVEAVIAPPTRLPTIGGQVLVGVILLAFATVDTHRLARGYLPSEQREREGEAPTALLAEGATQAPPIDLDGITKDLDGITKVRGLKPLKPVPAEYANKHMPEGWWTDPKIIKEGEKIYQARCFFCHGQDGIPKMKGVRNLSAVRMNRTSDSYWFWRISEGVPETIMAAWKGLLPEEDRWKVMAYEHQFSHGGRAEEHDHPEIERIAAGKGTN